MKAKRPKVKGGSVISSQFEGSVRKTDSSHVEICFAGHEKTPICVTTSKITTWNPFKAIFWAIKGRPIKEGFTKITVGKSKVVVKTEELASRLGLTTKELEDTAKVEQAVNGIEKHQECEKLATFFGTSVDALVGDAEKKRQAEEVMQTYNEVCKNLDTLGLFSQGNYATATSKGTTRLTRQDKATIRQVIRSALIVRAEHPVQKGEKKREFVRVTDSIALLVESDAASFNVMGLFGRRLGKGGHGSVVHTVDLLKGDLSTGNEAVIKVLHQQTPQRVNELKNEERISSLLNPDGAVAVLGLAKPVKILEGARVKSRGLDQPETETQAIYHLGPVYSEGSLSEKVKGKKISELDDRVWVAYQIVHGMHHMHSKNITHGDMKPGNVLMGPSMEASISDLGGAIDHNEDSTSQNNQFTQKYCVQTDLDALNAAKNKEERATILKQMDVFATSMTLYFVLTKGRQPFQGQQPYSAKGHEDPSLIREELKKCCPELRWESSDLIIKGLSQDRTKRPSMEELYKAFKRDALDLAPKHYNDRYYPA